MNHLTQSRAVRKILAGAFTARERVKNVRGVYAVSATVFLCSTSANLSQEENEVQHIIWSTP